MGVAQLGPRVVSNRWDEASRGEPDGVAPRVREEGAEARMKTVAAASTRAEARVTPTRSRTHSRGTEEEADQG
jgi:hypothetical protein